MSEDIDVIGTRGAKRADYAPSETQRQGAWIAGIEDGSPAWEAGLEPGMRIAEVNGEPLRDLIDWRWNADGYIADLVVFVPGDDEPYEAVLEREPGVDWGVDFEGVVFDGIRTCVNACKFCFMSMLPEDARSTLTLRDDDWRLSFLQGNFVTLTNVSDDEVDTIVERRLAPMNVSIHAVSADVRRSLIGAHASRGIEVLERLCDAGIEIHGQIVVCPGINDGDELRRTLDWVEARPSITSLALVPMGYTKYSRRFSRSFSDDADAARAVVRLVEPYQTRAREALGMTRFQLSDEFYLAAGIEVPPAEAYDGYPQFYDGIGMLRSFIDEGAQVCGTRTDDLRRIVDSLTTSGRSALLICGEAAFGVFDGFLTCWASALDMPVGELPVYAQAIRNEYYGGDVNVTGLIVQRDLLAQISKNLQERVVLLPKVMFNFDGLTLDGGSRLDIEQAICERGGSSITCDTSPSAFVDALVAYVAG